MSIYVRLLAKRQGRDWARRQSFGWFCEGDRLIKAAEDKASAALVAWSLIEIDTEFMVEVSPEPWH